jgi:hypothetical protein
MSDHSKYEEGLAAGLRTWLEENLSRFLSSLEFPDEQDNWTLPVIEDFVLIVAAKDYTDGGAGVFTLTPPGAASYRMKGLIATALES